MVPITCYCEKFLVQYKKIMDTLVARAIFRNAFTDYRHLFDEHNQNYSEYEMAEMYEQECGEMEDQPDSEIHEQEYGEMEDHYLLTVVHTSDERRIDELR